MSNPTGNTYPTWGINNAGQIFAVDTSNTVHLKSSHSDPYFYDLGVSEDGYIWALSSKPDPDGGGSALYWSDGSNVWNEITTSDPGGVRISGYTGSSCIYITGDQVLRTMDTNGTSTVLYNANLIYDADYGGGMIWAMLSDKVGEPITLHYSPAGAIDFKAFGTGQQIFPQSISVNYQGDCYAVDNFYPVYYSKDGTSTGSAGSGVDGQTIGISFKNWNYIVKTAATIEGNKVDVWHDEAGGTYKPAGFNAQVVLSTYYQP